MEGTNGREPTVPFEVFDDYTSVSRNGLRFCDDGAVPALRARLGADRIMRLLEPYVMKIDG